MTLLKNEVLFRFLFLSAFLFFVQNISAQPTARLKIPAIGCGGPNLDTVCPKLVRACHNTSIPGVGSNMLMIYNWGDSSPLDTVIWPPTPWKQHDYNISGSMMVILTAVDSLGANDADTLTIYVRDINWPSFNFSKDTICLGDTVFLINTSFTNGQYGTDFLNWNNLEASDTGAHLNGYGTISKKFSNSGSDTAWLLFTEDDLQIIQLNMIDSIGCSAKFKDSLFVKPSKSLDFDFSSGCPCNQINFQINGSYPDVSGWNWIFGDGTSSISTNPIHTFLSRGNHLITLTGNNTNGCNYRNSKLINICGYDRDPKNSRSEDNLLFANGHTIDFSTGIPIETPFTARHQTDEAAITFSDPHSGQLLIYSNAEKIYNAQQKLFKNGDNLTGFRSAHQGLTILPRIGYNNQYYLFDNSQQNGLYYNLIDLNLDTVLEKNIPLLTASMGIDTVGMSFEGSEIVTAVEKTYDCGINTEYWLLAGMNNTNGHHYAIFLVDENGIHFDTTVYLFSAFGSDNYVSPIIVSPNKTKLLFFRSTNAKKISLFDFDNNTATVSNEKSYNFAKVFWPAGVAFSPNSNYFYVQGSDTLFQFDANATDNIQLENSIQKQNVPITTEGIISSLKLHPNGKIYGLHRYSNGLKDELRLSVIQNPDNPLSSAGFTPSSLSFKYGYSHRGADTYHNYVPWRLPVNNTVSASFLVDSNCQSLSVIFLNTSDTIEDCIFYNPTKPDTMQYLWDFGDSTTYAQNLIQGSGNSRENPSHTYQDSGNYTVTLIVKSSNCCQDTFSQDIFISKDTFSFNFTYENPCIQHPVLFKSNSNLNINHFTYYWQEPINKIGQFVEHTFDKEGNYEIHLSAFDSNGCRYDFKDTIELIQCTIFVPNAFTPNQDNYNSIYLARSNVNQNLSLTIYNRLGKVLFQSKDPFNNGWDGTYKNKKVESGIYMYRLESIDTNTLTITGNISVIN